MDWLRKHPTIDNYDQHPNYKWVNNYHRKFVSSMKELQSQYKNATYGASKPEETKPEETKPWWDRDDDGEGKLSDTDYASAAAATAERKKKKDFEAKMAALDAEIAGYDAAVKEAHAEMRNIVIWFGIDAATTIFGGAILKGGASAIKALRGYSVLNKAQKAAKTQKALNALAKGKAPQPKPWTSSSYNPNKPGGGPARKRFPVGDSYNPQGNPLMEKKNRKEDCTPKFLKHRSRQSIPEVITPKQKRILREIKKPFEIEETPTKFKVKPTGRNNKVVGAELMKPIENPKAFKPDPNIWKAGHKKYNERSSQDKKNHVLELVGASEHHWSTLIERSDRERQEKVNEAMAMEFDREMEKLYEKYQKKESKVDKVIQSIKTASLDRSNIKPIHPDKLPPDTVDGYHPKYGQNYKHDKLDPHSAEFMPDTGNPTIDANIRKATDQEKKGRKVRILRKPNKMS
jgi:hypothetical protein